MTLLFTRIMTPQSPNSFLPIPAIDLMSGQVVRLLHGKKDQKKVYSDHPATVAAEFEAAGARRLHVVDLDGAFTGKSGNLDAIRAIRKQTKMTLELGGGLRTREDVERVFDLGVDFAILGTSALQNRPLIEKLAADYGDRLIVGIDAHDGYVAVQGWVETSDIRALDFALDLEHMGVGTVIYTDIATDGAMTGPNLPAMAHLAGAVIMDVIASGGIRNVEDLIALRELGCPNLIGAISGRAIYEKTLDLTEAVVKLK